METKICRVCGKEFIARRIQSTPICDECDLRGTLIAIADEGDKAREWRPGTTLLTWWMAYSKFMGDTDE